MNTSFTAHRPRAFTLIELLTVIAIIGILAAILVPTVGKVRSTAKKAQCMSNLRQWGVAIRLFTNDNKGLVALYNNLGSGTPSLQIYSPYFGNNKMVDPAGLARSSQEVMSRCPSAITDSADPEYRARCYAFVRGGGVGGPGMKRVDPTTFGLAAGATISCYNIADATTPSQTAMMMETHSPANSAITVDDPITGFNDHVRPQQVNTEQRLVRHSGAANMLFIDGHVASFSAAQTDFNAPANKAVMTQWFKLK